MRGALASVKTRLEKLAARVGEAAQRGCPQCPGPQLAWDAVPPDAPRACPSCRRPIAYTVIRWRQRDEEDAS